jgi:hypothetical protein
MAGQANTASITTNLNVNPYFDDFDESKNFHRILFRPGLAVQARELTQMQSILQNQIDRFAEHIFKEGSSVRGCEVNYDQNYSYIKLRDKTSTGASINVASFLDKTVKGTTSGVRAIVVGVADGSEANTPNFKTLFVKYTGANTAGRRYFSNNEILTSTTGSLSANTIKSTQGAATGFGSAVTVASGIIFAKDHFIRVNEQTLVLEKYSANSTYRVGYEIAEDIVTESSDTTLLEPASGSYNYTAPGAARLKLTPTLAKKSSSDTSTNNFIEVLQVKNGVLQSLSDKPEYSAIRDYMAKRTYEQSGDFVVRGMDVRLREHLRSGNNNGTYLAASGGNTSLISVQVEPGKAYVQGYDIEKIVTSTIPIEKAIDYKSAQDVTIISDYGNYVVVDNVSGQWDLNNQTTVTLRDTQANSISTRNYSLTSFPGTSIGTARVRGFEYYTGTPGLPSAQYKVYLSDIKITTAGKSFGNVQSIAWAGTSGAANGKADILGATGTNASVTDTAFDRAVFNIPARAIKRIRNTSGTVATDFTFYKSFDVTLNSVGQATINTGQSDETFSGSGVLSDASARQYYVVLKGSANTATLTGTVETTGSSNTITGTSTAFTTQVNPGDLIQVQGYSNTHLVTAVTNNTTLRVLNAVNLGSGKGFWKFFKQGQVIDMGGAGRDGDRSVNITSTTTAAIDINETLVSPSTLSAAVVVKLNKSNGQEASKVVNRSRLVQVRVGAGGGTSYTANTTGPWPLGLSDGFKLVSVRQKSGSNFASLTEGTDVTSHFYLDTGMRDSYYDHARLVKKSTSGLAIASGDRLLVKFDYFTHSYSTGVGYFSVDSYPVNDSTAGTDTTKIYTYDIPVYISPTDGKRYDLRDAVDMRPRVTDTANSVTSLTNVSINPLTSTSVDQPTGGLHFPAVGTNFQMDLDYYLKRTDLLVMGTAGGFRAVRGSPSLFPVTPETPAETMALARIELAPYPSLPDNIARSVGRPELSNGVVPVRNERYTMRDIGALRDRLDRVEYYTALTLLEKDAKSLQIQDSNGLDRFKNGIIVDAFTGHNIGNVFDIDYKISIDPQKGEARPPFKLDNVEMFYHAANSSNIVRTNYTSGGVSRDQTIFISNSQVKFSNGEIVTSGGSSATIRFQVNNKLYVENSSGNFSAAATVTGGSSGKTATISSVSGITPGDLVTLSYGHTTFVNQPLATTTRSCTGLFHSFVGNLTLIPDGDYWQDTTQLPDVQINFDFGADNWLNLANAWGTQWRDWETVWSGEAETSSREVVTGTSVTTSGDKNIVSERTQTESTIELTQAQSRTGTRLSVTPVTKTDRVGSRVRDVNIQPFMRSRPIAFVGRGFKPSTRLYAFFDGINVKGYVTPTNSAFANTANEGSSLTVDSSGNVYGIFRIPADGSLRFRTGAKVFRLTDSPTNESGIGLVTTSAQATYSAQGLSVQQQDTVISTRSAEVSTTTVNDTRTLTSSRTQLGASGERVVGEFKTQNVTNITNITNVTNNTTTVINNNGGTTGEEGRHSDFGDQTGQGTGDPSGISSGTSGFGNDSACGFDPIAQSFIINTGTTNGVVSSGAYVTKIDLFFATKDDSLPVTVELREVDSATAAVTLTVIPFSRVVIESSAVNTSDDGSAPTPVYFPSPVFLKNGSEYAVVIRPAGNSPNYRVFVARLGEDDLITGNRITSQPNAGMMYASSNDRAYTPIQEEDLKFRVYAADFNTASVGVLSLKNELRDYFTIANVSAGFTRSGEDVHGETLVIGTFANTKSVNTNVTYAQGMTSGATGTITYFSTSRIRIKNVSTTAKFKGGEKIRIRNTNATTGVIVGNSTGGVTSATYPTGKVAYYDAVTASNTYLHLANVSYTNSGPATFDRVFNANTWVRGQTNGYFARIVSLDRLTADVLAFNADHLHPSSTAIAAQGRFATSNSTRDTSLVDINLNGDTTFSSPRYVLSRSVESNTVASSSTMALAKSFEVVMRMGSTSRFSSPAVDLRRVSATIVNNLINSNTAIGSSEDYVKSGGSAKARYITRKVTLAEGQDAEDIRVYLTAYKPATGEVSVYYKVLHREDSDTFADSRWIPMTQTTSTTTVSDSQSTEDFREYIYDVPTYSNTSKSGANTTNSSILEYRNTASARFVGFKYFAIKIVLTNSTSSNPPRVRDLRVIALQR